MIFTKWEKFVQMYDSATRAFRRGVEVSRTVNWLNIYGGEGEPDTSKQEEEQVNREKGLEMGSIAKTEADIAKLVWEEVNKDV